MPLSPSKRALALVAAALLATSCKTIDVWDGGYPRKGAEIADETKKQLEFRRFAIHEGSVHGGTAGYVQTQRDAETEKYYGLDSFGPVMTEVSPGTKEDFDAIRGARPWEWVAVGLIFASIFVPHQYEESDRGTRADRVSAGLVGAGIVTAVVTDLYQQSRFDDAKTKYHRDLNQRIFGPTLSYAWTLGD